MINQFTTLGLVLATASTFLFSAPARAQEDSDQPAAEGKSLEQQMTGYWAPDPEAMMARFKKEIGDDPNAQAMLPMIQAMLAGMAAHITEDEVTIHTMGRARKSSYKVTKSDAATKMLTMDVTDVAGKVEEGTAKVDGDKLTLIKGDDSILFNRIKKDEFEKRLAAAPAVPGLPGGPVPAPQPKP